MWSRLAVVAVAFTAWTVATAVVLHRLPRRWFTASPPPSPRWVLLDRALAATGVRRWKDHLPTVGGPTLASLAEAPEGPLEAFAAEHRRSEWAHRASLGAVPAILLALPAYAAAPMVAAVLAVNVPCLVALAHNRRRAERLLLRRTGVHVGVGVGVGAQAWGRPVGGRRSA